MTIQQLINMIPFEILKRGESYYNNKKILQLNQGSDQTWYAEVEGNYDNYEVEIKPDNDSNSADYYCDCPYDGTICKHVAAVALAIFDKKTIPISSNDKIPDEESWEELIKAANSEDLRNFILDFGVKNKDFRHQIKLTFSKPASVQDANNIPYYQNQISGIFDNYDYRGFIDYRNSYKAMNDVSEFQIKADNYYSVGNLNEAFCISAAIAMESVKAIQNMDDSSGECGYVISEAFNVIATIINNNPSNKLKERIFNWLHEQVQNNDYNAYGVGDCLEPLFFDTAASLNKLEIAYKFIDTKIIDLDKEDSWSKKYSLQNYIGHKINLLQSEGRNSEAENIIDSYLHLKDFRQTRVKEALATNQLKKAEDLIQEGIKIALKDNEQGTVRQWKDQLLEVYKKQNQTVNYNKLAKELFIENTYEIKYFKFYKATSPKDGWETKRNKLIAELKNNKRGYYGGIPIDNLASIYIEEQMIEQLFALVSSSNSIHTIIRYTNHLKSKYTSELLEYYKAAIEIEAEQTGRNVYETLVQYLKQMSKLKGGLPAAKALKDSLLNNYKNRPAMKEIFKKLNWN
ncbi:SWIM zinc finger family protein [Plebeiibacterium sediminum]|uniref:SWIM zinc finger family protein n=1 Tax=Plebeiibacterium sediminum TaxID=2992112 RepID=A0AAE3M3A4_9BACT|nr:SWIM zinc finger family protein [Plebeiobacterium sediminum]MCW3786431.1 SWIM zinc finger family protein [Plebeiobacterium sediminum]